jgi:hypothetical protein
MRIASFFAAASMWMIRDEEGGVTGNMPEATETGCLLKASFAGGLSEQDRPVAAGQHETDKE